MRVSSHVGIKKKRRCADVIVWADGRRAPTHTRVFGDFAPGDHRLQEITEHISDAKATNIPARAVMSCSPGQPRARAYETRTHTLLCNLVIRPFYPQGFRREVKKKHLQGRGALSRTLQRTTEGNKNHAPPAPRPVDPFPPRRAAAGFPLRENGTLGWGRGRNLGMLVARVKDEWKKIAADLMIRNLGFGA